MIQAPELLASALTNYSYAYMFENCTSLNYIKCLATNRSAEKCTFNWVKGVAPTGNFYKSPSATWETGDYYAWEETEAKEKYDWYIYKWGTNESSITKYCTREANGTIDDIVRLKGCDNAARMRMGGA